MHSPEGLEDSPLHIVLFFVHFVFKNCTKFYVLFLINGSGKNLCREANSVNILRSDYMDINLHYRILFLIFQKKEIRRQTKRRIQPRNLRLKMARHLMR